MDQAAYRGTRPNSLADLLMMGVSSPPSAPEPDGAQDASGLLTPQFRQSLLEQVFASPDLGPAPKEENQSAGKAVTSSLADTLNSIASIYSRQNMRTDRSGDYQGRLDRSKQETEKFRRDKASAAAAAKRGKAEFLLGEDASARERKLAASAAKAAEDKADRLLREKIDREAAATAADQAFQLRKQKEASDLGKQEDEARFRHETGMKRMEIAARNKDDTKADKALQQFSLGSRIANGILRGVQESKEGPAIPPLAQRLAGDPENKVPPQTPDEIRREFEDEMTQEGIFGAPRDLARDYFNERLIRAWRQVKQQAEQAPPGQ